MAYEVKLAAYLSGVTISQLEGWAQKDIFQPEIQQARPKIYSFRDLVALRMLAILRHNLSLQKIRQSLDALRDQDFTDHLSVYRFATDGKRIMVHTDEGFMDLTKNPGQWELYDFQKIYESFTNFKGRQVPNLLNPHEGIEVSPGRLGGEPTVTGTRVSYELVRDLTAGDDGMTADEIEEFYPTISSRHVQPVLDFIQEIEENAA